MASKKSTDVPNMLPGMDASHRMPDGHYTGDTPNPNLRKLIEDSSTPYDPDSDDYQALAFNEAITSTKATAIYLMHSYHQGKKPHDAIRQYVRHYTRPGDIVLDPFSGSGGTALAAILEDRMAVAIDRSPAATFISTNYCSGFSPSSLQKSFNAVSQKVENEMEWLFGTKCERCGGDATVAYTVYSQIFQCPRCLEQVPFFECVKKEITASTGKPKKAKVCPQCLKQGHLEEISTKAKKFGHIPVLQCYICERGCKPSRSIRSRNDYDEKRREWFLKYDQKRLDEIEERAIPHWFPPHKMMNIEDDALPWGAEWRPGRNFRSVEELFVKRNLWAIAAIREAILETNTDCTETLLFALNAITLNCSRMYRYRDNLKGGFQQGTFYIPQDSQIINVFRAFADKVKDLCRASKHMPTSGKLVVSTQSACDLSEIPDDSIDYVFTDPPYGDSVQYGELNFIWEAWLGFDTHWHEDEIIVNGIRGKNERDWASMMQQAMSECFRVLKPGRWLSLCFHDDEQTWQLIQDVMVEVGFSVDQSDKVLFIDTNQKSFNQLTAGKSKKRDLVLNFRKPKAGDWTVSHLSIPAGADKCTFQEMGQQVIREFLTSHPGAMRDRIYDELVSRMVRRGEMEAHDFDALLRSIAEEVQEPVKEDLFTNKKPDLFGSHISKRWYLKETADQIDRAEQDKEDNAAARLEQFAARHSVDNPVEEGVHFSDLFEQVVTISVNERPRRLFENWLPEYFFKTADGTWRPPADEKERQQKAALREAGTLRRMKRFANALIEGVPVRDQDRPTNDRSLAEWIRQCRRAGLYEQGRALYEKGGLNLENLNDEEQIEVEDDYRLCVKRGSDDSDKGKSRKKKK